MKLEPGYDLRCYDLAEVFVGRSFAAHLLAIEIQRTIEDFDMDDAREKERLAELLKEKK